MSNGPLTGLRVVELAAIGPGPHATMLLSDLGAEVIRVERPVPGLAVTDPDQDPQLRGRRHVFADLKDPASLEEVLSLLEAADVLVEGYRPGVLERLGLGPDVCLERNPRLVYARVTGWGQDGPLARRAGHDINYISITGALNAIGPAGGPPVVPLNLVGDYGGGSLYLCVGVLAALWEASRSSRGQVVDAAMVDGVTSLLQAFWGMLAQGVWTEERGVNVIDGAAPFYDLYACADQLFVAVGALEPQFYAVLLDGLGLSASDLPDQHDQDGWPVLRERFTAAFRTRTRDEWSAIFDDVDACVTPVLSFTEAPFHPHVAARGSIIEQDGMRQAAPAPRFSRTPGRARTLNPARESIADVLADWRAR